MWYLYVIECCDGSLYTGIAVDVHKRFALHAQGKAARYTRAHPPKCLLGYTAYPDRSSVAAAEYALKQLAPAQKRQQVAQWAGSTEDRG